MKKINLKGVTAQTWTRTLVLVLALISQLAVILGKRSEAIDIDQWQEYVTYAFTVGASLVAWWKNNSFTGNAQKADKMLRGDENDGN
jgi:SPP1 family holin